MKKPKRIRALKMFRLLGVDQAGRTQEEVVYLLQQSDIRALAEQVDRDYHEDPNWGYPRTSLETMLWALKRAGMTPGKEIKTDGSLRSVKAAIKRARVGDTVMIPPGLHNWAHGKGAK